MGETENLEDVGYLQDIISYIFDEKKIVTYKWISNILAIHVNRAKQLLYTFIKHISEDRLKDLKVIYLVGGILPNDRGCRLQLVSEDDLKNVKTQFEIITSEHIYSVSLKNCLSDMRNICSVDGVKDSKVGRHGALRCTRGVARTIQEVTSKRQEAYKADNDEKKWPTGQSKQQEKESSAGDYDKKSSKPANNISAMFSVQNSKKKEDFSMSKKAEEMHKEENKSSTEKVPVTKNAPRNGKPPANRLAIMFSAQNAKPKNIKRDIQEESNSSCENKLSEKEARVSPNDSKSDQGNVKKDTDSKIVLEKPSKKKGSKTEIKKSKQKKRKASDNIEDKNKKRKRIVMIDDSDSSSDDIFGSSDEEEEKCHTHTALVNEEVEESIEIVAPKKSELPEVDTNHHCGRKRQLVDKTYEDEEGYIVTKKVYEYVTRSESDSEEEKENEKSTESKIKERENEPTSKAVKDTQNSEKNKSQKKDSPPEKKKQATLMNFFKRS